MEDKTEMGSLVTVKGDEASQGFCVSARVSGNPNPSPSQAGTPTMASTPQVGMTFSFSDGRKKRGRPRKYEADGPVAKNALSPMPISASIPLSGDFSGWKQPRARSIQRVKKAQKPEFENLGDRNSVDRLAYLGGANFTPHVITVNTGEDIAMKILSLSQQESRAICVMSASGSISNVTLRQPNSSGGTLTYEGRFEILSLTGSFMPTDNGIVKSRSGGMSVSLAGPDGRVLGGGLAGLLVAASPVQVVLGSFLQAHQQEQKPKKQRIEPTNPVIPAFVSPSVPQAHPQVQVQAHPHPHPHPQAQAQAHPQVQVQAHPQVQAQAQAHPQVQVQVQIQPQVQERGYVGNKVSFTSLPSFHNKNLPCMNSTQQDSRDFEHDHNISSPEGEYDDDDDDVYSDDDNDNLEISG